MSVLKGFAVGALLLAALLLCTGTVAGLIGVESHGVYCGSAFKESARPLQADLDHLNATNRYNASSSAVVRCARRREVQAAGCVVLLGLGLGALTAGGILVAIWRVRRPAAISRYG